MSFWRCISCIVFFVPFVQISCTMEVFLGLLIRFVFHGEDFLSFSYFLYVN